MYSGSPAKLILPNGQPGMAVHPKGLDLDLENVGLNPPDADVEAKISFGNHADALSMPKGNAPTLNITSSRGAATVGSLVITTPVKNAVLALDGAQENGRTTRLWRLKAGPGEHVVTLSAAGMNDQEIKVRLAKGESATRKVVMTAAAKLSTLVIKNGMTGTKVTLDHAQFIGVVNAAGAFIYDKVAPGDHDITLDLAGYASITSRQAFKEGQALELHQAISSSES